MSVFTHLSLSPINIAAALCSAKAYNSAYAKGEQMINDTMYARGAESSIIREIFSYGLERKAQIGAENVFDFSLGNPSVPAPAAVAESIKKALELPSDQLHGYTPAPGLPQCRTAVAESLNRRFGTSYEGKDVFMTVGAAASLTCTLNAITNPGDEVIVIAPYFPEYRVWIEKAGCTCVEALADEDTFQLSVDNVLKAITDKTAAVIIDSPNNPTGAVYTRDTLTRLAKVLCEVNAKRDPENPIMLISDEPYREIVYGAEVPWVPSIYEHTIVCYSYSKSLSLPGERIGYVLVPPAAADSRELYAAVCGAGRALGYVCAPSMFQRVAARCADQTSDIAVYQTNRDLLFNGLTSMGYHCVKPDGAFYLFPQTLEADDRAFSERAKKYDLLVVPGADFGAPGHMRISYCVKTETIERALPLFERLAKEYR